MVNIIVPSIVSNPIIVASLHGATDMYKNPLYLLSYIPVLIIPRQVVFPLFMISSIYHFSTDYSVIMSIMLHICIVAISHISENISWVLFSIYYCIIHAPFSIHSKYRNLFLFTEFVSLFLPSRAIRVTYLIQKTIIGHILCNLVCNTNVLGLLNPVFGRLFLR